MNSWARKSQVEVYHNNSLHVKEQNKTLNKCQWCHLYVSPPVDHMCISKKQSKCEKNSSYYINIYLYVYIHTRTCSVHTAVCFPCVLGTLYSWSLILYGTITDPRKNISGPIVTPKPSSTPAAPTGTVTTTKRSLPTTSGRRICFVVW